MKIKRGLKNRKHLEINGCKIFASIVLIALLVAFGCADDPEKTLRKAAEKDPYGPAAKEYIARYPDGERAQYFKDNFNSRAYTQAIETAARTNTIDPLVKYLDEYPSGNNAYDIDSTLKNMLFEKRPFTFFGGRYDPTEEDPRIMLNRYLALSPNGIYADRATAAIDNLNWLEANLINTNISYINYLAKGEAYSDQARRRLQAMEEMPELKPGITVSEVEDLLGPPAKKTTLYPGADTSDFGKFYSMHYPDHGIRCDVRKTKKWEKVFSFTITDPYMSSYQGIKIGMTRDELLSVCDRLPQKEDTHYELFSPKDRYYKIQITWSGRYPSPAEYRDLYVATDEESAKYGKMSSSLVKYNNGKLPMDIKSLAYPLSGQTIYIKRAYGTERVEQIIHTDMDLHGPFFTMPRFK